MATRYTDEFRRDVVRIATTSGLTRPQVSSDLGGGLSTLNKWVQKHQHDDLMSGPHEDVERENERLRKEVRLLREDREVLKRASIHRPVGLCEARSLEVSLRTKAPSHACKHA
jgi:transposase